MEFFLFLTFISAAAYLFYFFYKKEVPYFIFLLGILILLIRIYGLRPETADEYYKFGGSLRLWIIEAANNLLYAPIFFTTIGALCLIWFSAKRAYRKRTLKNILLFAFCLAYLLISFSIDSQKRIPHDKVEYFISAYLPIITYFAFFILLYQFKRFEEFTIIEKEFPEFKESKSKLEEYVKHLTKKIEGESEIDWKMLFARGKSFYGLGKYLDAKKDLEGALKILSAITKIDLTKLDEIKSKPVNGSLKKPIESIFLTLSLIDFRLKKSGTEGFINKAQQISGNTSKYESIDDLFLGSSVSSILSVVLGISVVLYFLSIYGGHRKVGFIARTEDRKSILLNRKWNYKFSEDSSNNIYIGEYKFYDDNIFDKTLVVICSNKYSKERNSQNKENNSTKDYDKIVEKTYFLKGNITFENNGWKENIILITDHKQNSFPLDSIPTGLPIYGNYHTDIIDCKINSFNNNEIDIVSVNKKNNIVTHFLMWDGKKIKTKELSSEPESFYDKIIYKIKNTFPISLFF